MLFFSQTSNAANAAKKAAKKAEAKAKKAAMKATAASGKPLPAAASNNNNKQKGAPAKNNNNNKKKAAAVRPANRLQPMQLSFNPNVELNERPVVSLAIAVLTNTAADLNILSDHHRLFGPALGLACGTQEVTGDFAIARYLWNKSSASNANTEEEAMWNQWMDYASSIHRFPLESKVAAVSATLESALSQSTYLVGSSISLADLAIFAALGFPTQQSDLESVSKLIPTGSIATKRWVEMMAAHPALKTATQLALDISNKEADFGAHLEPMLDGMSPLVGATPGNVVTRFPPEPSGYLHIGHAKAVLMNEYYARRYQGRLIVRFDDTNPSKEKEEFQSSILEDLHALGVSPDVVTYTSDYFPTIQSYALFLINNGLAFMDDTPQEQMQKERMEREESKHRNQSHKDTLAHFALMCSGKEEGAKWCLRAKMDMKSDNGTMRDPVIYRQNNTPHHRSGTTYKAYPTYDLACPIVDSIEGVTHALRTTEYNDRDEQYAWFQSTMKLRRVRIQAFARMNFMHTVLSKRHLTWFVDEGLVTGWDDARFPTVRGVVRRGIHIPVLRQFMCSQGSSRRIVNMEWSKFWAENKKSIDKTAKRFMAIDKTNHVKLNVTNGPSPESNTFVTASYLPKDPSAGSRVIRISNQILLEQVDTQGIIVGEKIVLMRWGVVEITAVNDDGSLEGTYVPDGDIKAAKRKLTWMSVSDTTNIDVTLTEFDNLISKEKLEEGESFRDFLNPNTMAASVAIGDASLRTLKKNDIIQLERRGYYRVDQPYISPEKTLILFMIPDGKAKAMSGLTGKLAHH